MTLGRPTKPTAPAKTAGRILRIDTPRAFLPLLGASRYKGAYGGRGSGKSHFFAELLIEDCLAQHGMLAVCVSESSNGHAVTLLSRIAHEMIHLRQHLTGDHQLHGPRFQRMAAKICATHGFDPKTF